MGSKWDQSLRIRDLKHRKSNQTFNHMLRRVQYHAKIQTARCWRHVTYKNLLQICSFSGGWPNPHKMLCFGVYNHGKILWQQTKERSLHPLGKLQRRVGHQVAASESMAKQLGVWETCQCAEELLLACLVLAKEDCSALAMCSKD